MKRVNYEDRAQARRILEGMTEQDIQYMTHNATFRNYYHMLQEFATQEFVGDGKRPKSTMKWISDHLQLNRKGGWL